jgi:transcriptional regulator with XRE-family HTH domain
MTGHMLEEVRKGRGVSQLEAAKMLGLSQPMLSHMETGRRNVSADVARKAVELFGADPTVLPLSVKERHSEQELATELASLGYPGFAHLKGLLRNPAEVLFDALDRSDLDVRVTEGLPWLALHYPNLDWTWLVRESKLRNRQNRLGFVVSLAELMAGSLGLQDVLDRLKLVRHEIEEARLANSDTLCQESLPISRRRHVRSLRSRLAAHWNLDTHMTGADLAHYAA